MLPCSTKAQDLLIFARNRLAGLDHHDSAVYLAKNILKVRKALERAMRIMARDADKREQRAIEKRREKSSRRRSG